MRCEDPNPEDPTRTCLMPRDHRTAAHLDAEGSWPNQPVHAEVAERRLHRIDAKAQHRRAVTLAADIAASRRQSGYSR